jgi:hypothetical protein
MALGPDELRRSRGDATCLASFGDRWSPAMHLACVAGGKSELHRTRCRVTPGEGDLEDSATENKPPAAERLAGKGEKAG